jgi:hypothetical protein
VRAHARLRGRIPAARGSLLRASGAHPRAACLNPGRRRSDSADDRPDLPAAGRIEDVPALLVHGARLGDRLRLIERLMAQVQQEERCAVLLTSPRITAPGLSLLRAAAGGVVVRVAGGGCLCCVGQVSFRVALTKLLREARPDRVIIELGHEDHLRRAIATVTGDHLSRALRLAGVMAAPGD